MSRPSHRARWLLASLGALAALMVGFVVFAGIWTDRLWYRSVRYSSVFSTLLWTKAGLFLVFGLLLAAAVGVNVCLAYRLRPPLSAMSAEQQGLDRYRTGVAPYKKRVLFGVCALVGLIGGGAAASQWRLWLLTSNATPFHVKDPQFHKDVSFYAFDLPWYRFLLDFGFAAAVLSLIAATAVHYLYGGLRITSPGGRVTPAATGHLAVLLGLFVSLKAVAYWLDRYQLAVKSSGLKATGGFTGLRYVDVNAYLPAKTILFCIAVICALLFFSTLWRRSWSLPAIGFGLLVLSSILIGGLYPAIMQRFQVLPHEAAKEAPYVQRNIDATRAAYGIEDAEVTPYPAGGAGTDSAAASDQARRAAADSAADVPVLDPNVVSPTFRQLQQNGAAYQFPSTLDVERSTTAGGKEQDTVVGARELDLKNIPRHSWIDDHFKYTHGFGVVAAKSTEVTGDGGPVFTEEGLPDAGSGSTEAPYRKQIYFGEQTRQYSIVGGPTPEADYAGRNSETTTAYAGKDGVSLRNPLTRAAYAVSFGEPRILSSGAIDAHSKILYNRTPKERVEAVAPWLTVDGDPYPAVVGKNVLWVVDAYTTTDDYPYASRTGLAATTADSLTDGRRSVLADHNQVNYIRNAVKATVDAYDGTVTLYQWDTQDPVLKTWMKAFPGTVRPKAEIPADLLARLRYPQDLFKVQRQLLTTYHVTDAADFSRGSQAWEVPDDPTARTGRPAPPYYQSLTMPGRTAQAFSLTTAFTAGGQQNLSAFMAVDSDATSSDYGTIRILQPTGATTPGPQQVQTKIDALSGSAAGRADLRAYGADSVVEYGNLLTVPVDGGLLYVEPVYVHGKLDYPRVRRVAVVYGARTAYEPTLSKALDGVFEVNGGTPATVSPPPSGDAALQQALADAQNAMEARDKALRTNDRAGYGVAQDQLSDALRRAQTAGRQPAGAG